RNIYCQPINLILRQHQSGTTNVLMTGYGAKRNKNWELGIGTKDRNPDEIAPFFYSNPDSQLQILNAKNMHDKKLKHTYGLAAHIVFCCARHYFQAVYGTQRIFFYRNDFCSG
ncbi:MAG: hypothetical protein ABJC98_20010, partial [Bacteroidota bacterium]